jgi:hypothetical protein
MWGPVMCGAWWDLRVCCRCGSVAPDVRVIALLAYRKLANTRGAMHYLEEQCSGVRHLFTLVSLISVNCDGFCGSYRKVFDVGVCQFDIIAYKEKNIYIRIMKFLWYYTLSWWTLLSGHEALFCTPVSLCNGECYVLCWCLEVWRIWPCREVGEEGFLLLLLVGLKEGVKDCAGKDILVVV